MLVFDVAVFLSAHAGCRHRIVTFCRLFVVSNVAKCLLMFKVIIILYIMLVLWKCGRFCKLVAVVDL